jgi:hypothetical protein
MACCPGGGCQDGLACSPTTNTCERCGGTGEACCSDPTVRCAPFTACDSQGGNVCRSCGLFGLPCCTTEDSPCLYGLMCNTASNTCGGG